NDVRVEVPSDRSSEALVELNGKRRKEKRTRTADDRKDAPAGTKRGDHQGPHVEINPPPQGYGAAGGRRLHSRWRLGGRYLFAQEHVQVDEEPPLPPSQFNP